MRLEMSSIGRPGFVTSDSVEVLSMGQVFLNGVRIGGLREVAPDLYELVVRGALLADADGEIRRIFGRAESAVELASLAKQEVSS